MISSRFNNPSSNLEAPGILKRWPGIVLALIVVVIAFSVFLHPVASGEESNYAALSDWTESQRTAGQGTAEIQGANYSILVPISNISSKDIILDISPEADRFIEGAINIDYEDFLADGGKLKPVQEIARLLGAAGISRHDSVVITGQCLPCGGGPAPATYTYWLLKYLGHDKVRVLDGGIENWVAAGLPTSNESSVRQATNYAPEIKAELLATRDFVLNSGAQIVDARSAQEYALGSIPGAVNLPTEYVLDNESIMDMPKLEEAFSGLEKDNSVVVFTNIGVQASVLWFALTLSGYDARLYSWQDWIVNQPQFELQLAEVKAEPNPVKTGDSVSITVTFEQKVASQSREAVSSNDTKLTVKGCVTCGFGSPQSFANMDSESGMVQIGSSGKPSQASVETLKCTAVIKDSQGVEVGEVNTLRTSGEKYFGIWNANVAPGVYTVSIAATESGSTKIFADVLEIEVTG